MNICYWTVWKIPMTLAIVVACFSQGLSAYRTRCSNKKTLLGPSSHLAGL